jgi:hypothetical protein
LVDLHGLITVSADVAKELDVLFVIDWVLVPENIEEEVDEI